ncbi:MAG TPA: Holliday junction branch migration protein RuvA [Pyrinomonadaceae bacterium]|nr:Holliday junction branch migration protein RuvA [Pyrinomonadaceae bacterium]
MIAHLTGKILEKDTDRVVIDVGGVGYEVGIPLSTYYELGEIGADVSLRIHTHVREDAIQLFGFQTARERDLYLLLISVQGVGAKSGVTLLSGMSSDDIVLAIRSGNITKLTSIPGVGKKTAERLIVELRDKVASIETGKTASVSLPTSDNEVVDDALSALVNLGYQKAAAEKALQQAMKEGSELTVQKLLRSSLQILAK